MGKKRKILLVLLIVTVAFIWIQSALPVETSAGESKAVAEKIVNPLQTAINGKITIKEHRVRKLAHITEFFALGVLSQALFSTYSRRMKASGSALCLAMVIAVCDETVQVFSKRGAQIQDVWIDIFGAFLGISVSLVCSAVYGKFIKSKNRERE